jgi:hypothetical protein
MAKLTKKQALEIASLISDLDMASSAVSRHCAKENPDGAKLTFWMNDRDETLLKLRAILGVKIQDTYEELRQELTNQMEADYV